MALPAFDIPDRRPAGERSVLCPFLGTSPTLPTHRQAIVTCALTALSALVCAGLVAAAVLVPAPRLALPFVIAVGVGYPMVAVWQSHASLTVLRRRLRRPHKRALTDLRRELERLPETRHPLDL
jgi:hypothetical protein